MKYPSRGVSNIGWVFACSFEENGVIYKQRCTESPEIFHNREKLAFLGGKRAALRQVICTVGTNYTYVLQT